MGLLCRSANSIGSVFEHTEFVSKSRAAAQTDAPSRRERDQQCAIPINLIRSIYKTTRQEALQVVTRMSDGSPLVLQ